MIRVISLVHDGWCDSKRNIHETNILYQGGEFWLDITDDLIEGVWTWQSTGRSATYTDWAPTEPNTFQGTNEDCAVFASAGKYQWADVPCSNLYRPLCEKRFKLV